MKKLLLLILLPLLLAASCNKDEPENPYKNVVRCKINGVPWEAQCEGNIVFGCNAVEGNYKNHGDTLITVELYALGGKTNKRLNLLYNARSTSGISNFYPTDINEIKYSDVSKSEICKKYFIDISKGNKFSVTKIDSINSSDRAGTVEGVFNFSCFNSCNDTIKITDGYFRMGYH